MPIATSRTQMIIATAVPHEPDATGRGLLISAHVSIRLTPMPAPGLSAADYPTFVGWPQTMPSWRVEFDGGAAQDASVLSAAPDATLWSQLFPAGMPIRNFHEAGASRTAMVTNARRFDAEDAFAKIKNTYLGDTPIATAAAIPITSPGPVPTSTLPLGLSIPLVPLSVFGPDLDPAIAAFYAPVQAARTVSTRSPADVHDRLAYLHDYPATLTTLGLIVELQVAQKPPDARRVRVIPTWAADDPLRDVRSPWTALAPRSAPTLHTPVTVIPLDITHAAGLLSRVTSGSPLPALRTGGMCVVRADTHAALLGRAAQVDAVEAQLVTANAPDLVVLDPATDLLLGHRIDVRDITRNGSWQSLCRRRYQLTVLDAGGNAVATTSEVGDEGYVSTAMTAAGEDAWVSDVLARWHGWSLVVPRPGSPQRDSASSPVGGLACVASAEGLPPLRFGHVYAFRLRPVDVTGHSDAADVPDSVRPPLGPSETYGRAEPAAPPILRPQTSVGPGESVSTIAVRSSGGDQPIRMQPAAGRWVLPPATTVDIAEQHGCFDVNGEPDPNAYSVISRYAGTIRETPVFHGVKKATRLATMTSATQPTIDYLPDPAVDRAVITILDDAAALGVEYGHQLSVPFRDAEGTWPASYRPFLLELQGTDAGTTGSIGLSRDGSVMAVVPAGTQVAIAISSGVDPAFRGAFTMQQWAEGRLPAERLSLISPSRAGLLVHAVQRPVRAPTFLEAPSVAPRQYGQTTAALSGALEFDASASQVDVFLDWTDLIDDTDPHSVPTPRAYSAHLGAHGPVQSAGGAPLADLPGHDFADCRARRVTVRAVATSRFAEYFDADMPVEQRQSPPVVSPVLLVGATTRPAPPRVQSVIPTYGWDSEVSAKFHSLTVTRGPGGLRIYLSRPFARTGAGEQLAVITGGVIPEGVSISNASLNPELTFPSGVASQQRTLADGTPVTIVPFAADWDGGFPIGGGRWSSDVLLSQPDNALGVRLKVATYQPDADPALGCWLSDPVDLGWFTLPESYSISVGLSDRWRRVLADPASVGGPTDCFEVEVTYDRTMSPPTADFASTTHSFADPTDPKRVFFPVTVAEGSADGQFALHPPWAAGSPTVDDKPLPDTVLLSIDTGSYLAQAQVPMPPEVTPPPPVPHPVHIK